MVLWLVVVGGLGAAADSAIRTSEPAVDAEPTPTTGGTVFGAWWAHVPLKNSNSLASSDPDINGTLAALRAANMRFIGLGFADPSSGKTAADFVAFLDAAAVQFPELRVFAVTGSHSPLYEYPPEFLNDGKSDVNWTRAGSAVATATLGRPNFGGLYVDDFYCMICRPEIKTFGRHGSAATPCVSVSAMDEMRAVAKAINPKFDFIPLVYHSQAQWAVPHSYVLGAPSGVPFVPPAMAAVSLQMSPPLPSNNGAAAQLTLRFFATCSIAPWTERYQKAAGRASLGVAGLLTFEARVNGQIVLSMDASKLGGPSLFELDVSEQCETAPSACNVSFATRATAAAAEPAHAWLMRDGVYRTSYVYGIALVDQAGTVGPLAPVSVQYESQGSGVIAREPTESRIVGHSDAMIVQRTQNPSGQLSTANYSLFMRTVKSANPTAKVMGGHYSRLGLQWDQPVSPVALHAGIQADVATGLAGSLVWEMELLVGRCRSRFDSCNEGVFSERHLPAPSSHQHGAPDYNAVLFWPNLDGLIPGWFSRYTSATAVPAGHQVQIRLADSRALENATNPVNKTYLRKRVVGVSTGTVYYDSPSGHFANGTDPCSETEAPCIGSAGMSDGASCRMKCARLGPGRFTDGLGLINLTIVVAAAELLAVELRTGDSGCGHCLTTIQLNLPPQSVPPTTGLGQDLAPWRFSSGLDDEQDLSLRALFNATVEVFAANPSHIGLKSDDDAGANRGAGCSIFVSSTHGDDENAGTAGAPLRTPEAALLLRRRTPAAVPCTINLAAGTYYISAPPLTLGAEDSHTKWVGEGRSTVLSAGMPVNDTCWKRSSAGAGVYSCTLPATSSQHFRVITVGGQRKEPARFPDYDPSEPYTGGFLYVNRSQFIGGSSFVVGVSEASLPTFALSASWAGAKMMIFPTKSWVNVVEVSIKPAALPVLITVDGIRDFVVQCPVGGACSNTSNHLAIGPGNRFFIYGEAAALSADEWHYEDATRVLSYHSPAGAPPTNVVVPQAASVLKLAGHALSPQCGFSKPVGGRSPGSAVAVLGPMELSACMSKCCGEPRCLAVENNAAHCYLFDRRYEGPSFINQSNSNSSIVADLVGQHGELELDTANISLTAISFADTDFTYNGYQEGWGLTADASGMPRDAAVVIEGAERVRISDSFFEQLGGGGVHLTQSSRYIEVLAPVNIRLFVLPLI